MDERKESKWYEKTKSWQKKKGNDEIMLCKCNVDHFECLWRRPLIHSLQLIKVYFKQNMMNITILKSTEMHACVKDSSRPQRFIRIIISLRYNRNELTHIQESSNMYDKQNRSRLHIRNEEIFNWYRVELKHSFIMCPISFWMKIF